MMDIEKLIEYLRNCARLGDSPIMDGFAVIADKRKLDNAATALSTLKAENEKLRVLAELGNTRAKDYRVMRDRAVKAEAENEKLRAELNICKEKNAGLALALLTECAPNPDCLGDDEWRAIRAELEQVRRERDAAVKDLETLCRDDVGSCEMAICELCAYNSGVQCPNPDGRSCDGYDVFNWKWRGPQKED